MARCLWVLTVIVASAFWGCKNPKQTCWQGPGLESVVESSGRVLVASAHFAGGFRTVDSSGASTCLGQRGAGPSVAAFRPDGRFLWFRQLGEYGEFPSATGGLGLAASPEGLVIVSSFMQVSRRVTCHAASDLSNTCGWGILAGIGDAGDVEWTLTVGQHSGVTAMEPWGGKGMLVHGCVAEDEVVFPSTQVATQVTREDDTYNCFVALIDPLGVPQWLLEVPGIVRMQLSSDQERIIMFGFTSRYPLVIDGVPVETVPNADTGFVAEVGADGHVIEASSIGHGTGFWAVHDASMSADGFLWMSGVYHGQLTLGGRDATEVSLPKEEEHLSGDSKLFLARFSPTMDLTWARTVGAGFGPTGARVFPVQERMVLIAYVQGSMLFENGTEISGYDDGSDRRVVSELSADGALGPVYALDGDDRPYAFRVAVDREGSIYSAGIYWRNVECSCCSDEESWGPQEKERKYTLLGGGLLAKWTATGQRLWSVHIDELHCDDEAACCP